MHGAGGTPGGTGRFLLGLALIMAGTHLFLSRIQAANGFWLNHGLFYVRGLRVTSGLMLVPLGIGAWLLFFNFRNLAGWVLLLGSLAVLVLGTVASLGFYLLPLSGFEWLAIAALAAGGAALLASSFRSRRPK